MKKKSKKNWVIIIVEMKSQTSTVGVVRSLAVLLRDFFFSFFKFF